MQYISFFYDTIYPYWNTRTVSSYELPDIRWYDVVSDGSLSRSSRDALWRSAISYTDEARWDELSSTICLCECLTMRKIYIPEILELPETHDYMKQRNIFEQYKKVKKYLLIGYSTKHDFKERNPPGSWIWSFRINKQYRAFGRRDTDGSLLIHTINNHQ